MTLVSASIIQFLGNFFTEADINIIVSDVNNLELYFPLNDKKNTKNYLNILINVFNRYRIECIDITDLSSYPLLSYGKDFTSRVVSDQNSSFELIHFTKSSSSDFKYLSESYTQQFFQIIASSFPDLPKVDLFSSDSPEYILNKVLSSSTQSDDNGFASYFQINYVESKKGDILPKTMPTKLIIAGIEKCLRYYAYHFIFKTWKETYQALFNESLNLTKISDLKKAYFVLEWFFTGSHEKRSFFHLQTIWNFRDWVEYCRTGVFNTFDKNISYKLEFNEVFVSKIRQLLFLVEQKPFCREEECVPSELQDLFQFFLEQNPLNDLSSINSHDAILTYYNHLELLFQFFNMSFEAERFLLQANQFLELIINKLVIKPRDTKEGLYFPLKLLWKNTSNFKSSYLYANNPSDADKKFINFLAEYIFSKGISSKNFYNYSSEIEKLLAIQDKLIIIGDLPSKSKIDLPDAKELFSKKENLSLEEVLLLSEFDSSVRKILSRIKKFWYNIVIVNPLYTNDPVFKNFFDTSESKDVFGVIPQLEKYFVKWSEYKTTSKAISQLEEEIEIISKLKYNIEGLRLLSRKFSGAMSFINGKALMEKEKSRLIDAILKDLVGTQLSFHFNEGIHSKLELIQLSTDEQIISSAIEVVEETQNFKKQILNILKPLPVIETVETFIQHAKILLGNTFKTIQITRYLENYTKWVNRLQEETQLLLVGMHIKNFNEYTISLLGTITTTISQISRFYKGSLSQEAMDKVNIILSTKHIGIFLTSLAELNNFLGSLIVDLNKQLVHLHLYSEKLAEITEEVYSSYAQLINTEDVTKALTSIKIKFKIEKNLLTIEERITDKESLLKKQLFIEKAFRLSLLLNSVFVLIERKLNEEFKPLIINSTYINLEEVGDNVSLQDRIEIIRTILENIVDFLKSIKILSRRHTQVLKIIIYYAPILIDRLGLKDILKTRVFSILQLVNNYNRHIKNFSILKDLNTELIQFNEQIFLSFKEFLNVNISDKIVKDEIVNSITLESTEPIYSRNFLFWAKKIQLAVMEVATETNIESLVSSISDKFLKINLDQVQEEILNIFISRKEEEKLIFKKREVVKRATLERERSQQEEILALQEKIRILEEQISILQEENQRLKGLPPLERPEVIEPEKISEIGISNEIDIERVSQPITDIRQEILPSEEIRSKRNIEKVSIFATKIGSEALVPAKSAEEVNPDLMVKIDPKPVVEEDELASLPEYDLIKELRKIGELRFMPLFKEGMAESGSDLITEIENLIETQNVLGTTTSGQVITPERTENDELVEEVTRQYKKEPESIFAFNLEEKIVPETTFRFKSPAELAKFAEKDKKVQEKSLDSMKSLKEEIAEYDEKPSALEIKINAYAKELFGEEEEEEVKGEPGKKKDSPYDLVNEMEKLIDPKKKEQKKK